jgi:HEAT repeat protein
MSVEVLRALDADVRSLLTAGTAAAAQDPALRKRAGALREVAGQAPALKPLSDRLSAVVAGGADSSRALLDLQVLLRQVRAGLCMTDAIGPLEPLAESGPWLTTVLEPDLARPLRWLQRPSWDDPWRNTRFFLMRQSDLRLVGPILDRLSEKGADVLEFVSEKFLPQYGPAVLPELKRFLEQADVRNQARALMAICHIDGRLGAEFCRPRLDDPDAKVRTDALRCLTVAAPDEARRTALAWLEGRLPVALVAAAWKCLGDLRRVRAADLPALLRALPRARGCGAPEVVALAGRAAVRPLMELLRSPDSASRVAAASALRRLGPKAAPAVPRLIELLDDPDEQVVTYALSALSEIGEAARAAVPRVIELCNVHRTEAGIGFGAANALAKIGRDDPDAIAAVIARIDSKDRDVVFNAVSRVAEIGPAAGAAVPRLVALYKHRNSHWQFRMHLLEALAALGPAAAEARPLLEKALRDGEVRLRYGAALALGMIGPAGKAAVPVLLEAMHDSHDSWWWVMHGEQGLRALGAIGPAATAAVPALIEAARTAYSERRRRAAREALAAIRGER